MKKLYILALMAVISVGMAKAITPYEPPTFNADEWTYIGIGSYEPGILDYFGSEWPLPVDCIYYESKATNGTYWIKPLLPEGIDPEEPEYIYVDGEFIVHTENPNQVWTTPIWYMHPILFCFYQMVPEVMGMQGSASAYGKFENWRVTFPAQNFILGTMPTGSPTSNNAGTFAINIPDPAGINAVASDNCAPVYYNLQGVEVANPMAGQIYIAKQGNKVSKVRF